MSHSTTSPRKKHEGAERVPRAVIHKKILDVAESRPDASMEAIADDVSGATVSIVEQVLEEYGDPGEQNADGKEVGPTVGTPSDLGSEMDTKSTTEDDDAENSVEGDDGESSPEPGSVAADGDESEPDVPAEEQAMSECDNRSDFHRDVPVEPTDVTEKQLETLEEIYRRPAATQAELADNLGVSSATINQRVNSIDGFDWSNRHKFVKAIFGGGSWFDDGDKTVDKTDRIASRSKSDRAVTEPTDERVTIERGEDVDRGAGESTDPIEAPDTGHTMVEDEGDATRISHTDGGAETDTSTRSMTQDTSEARSVSEKSVDELAERLDELTRRIQTLEAHRPNDAPTRSGVLSDPELAHKVIHACITADHISEEEELRLLKEMLTTEHGCRDLK